VEPVRSEPRASLTLALFALAALVIVGAVLIFGQLAAIAALPVVVTGVAGLVRAVMAHPDRDG
jgi:hypothetical protein